MIHYDTQTILLAVLGMVGLLSTLTILVYSFKRNKTSTL